MELLTVPVLHTRHGFPLRWGGVSAPPFDSLNCSQTVGDSPAAVAENLARLAAAAHVHRERLISVSQVHGTSVVNADEVTAGTEADAVWTDAPQTAVGVRTADCVPILLEDGHGRVAAVHAGWRGVIGNIVARTIEQLIQAGSREGALRAAIGPCIQACCFEVDSELAARFEQAFGAQVARHPANAKPHLDLPAAVKQQLEACGVSVHHIAALPMCTRCDGRFFSYRRDGGVTGRHLSFITCQGASAL